MHRMMQMNDMTGADHAGGGHSRRNGESSGENRASDLARPVVCLDGQLVVGDPVVPVAAVGALERIVRVLFRHGRRRPKPLISGALRLTCAPLTGPVDPAPSGGCIVGVVVRTLHELYRG